MRHPRYASVFAILLFASALSLPAADPSGHWTGSIKTPHREVKIEVDLAKNASGAFAGTFSNPSQNVNGFPLSNVAVQDATVGFELNSPGGGAFRGALAADGQSIAGEFLAGTMAFPFTLTRTGDAVIVTPKSPAIAKELEGTWTGTADDMGGNRREVTIRLANHADGTATGVVVTPQGVEIPITKIAQKESVVTLDVQVVGGTFEATLSADGTELAGMWTHADIEAPLTLRRAKPRT